MRTIFNTKPIVKTNDEDKICLIQNKILTNQRLSLEEIDEFLSYVCDSVRMKLAKKNNASLEKYDYLYQCDRAQAMIGRYFEQLNLPYKSPQTNMDISLEVLGHNFIVCFINDEVFLLDPTYNQFFDESKCTKENFKIENGMISKTADPGFFVALEKEEDQEMVCDFLEKGYGLLTEDLARVYGNSFYGTKALIPIKEFDIKGYSGPFYIKRFITSQGRLTTSYETLEKEGLNIGIFAKKESKIR